MAGNAAVAVPQAEYDALIMAARDGQAASAIKQLRTWHAAYPGHRRIVYDLVTLLNLAGDHEGALEFRQQLLSQEAPVYALKAFGNAARKAGRAGDAEVVYKTLATRTPGDAEVHAGLAYAWMAQDRLQDAFDYVTRKIAELGRGLPVRRYSTRRRIGRIA